MTDEEFEKERYGLESVKENTPALASIIDPKVIGALTDGKITSKDLFTGFIEGVETAYFVGGSILDGIRNGVEVIDNLVGIENLSL